MIMINSTPQLNHITNLIAADLTTIQKLIITHCNSTNDLLNTAYQPILQTPGKMIRPIVSIIAAHLSGGCNAQHHAIAASIELLHTASLLHDDVIDHATTRRKHTTINAAYSNSFAILAGDFLFAQAAKLSTVCADPKITNILSTTMATMVTGEILQLQYSNDLTITTTQYWQIITQKTALLFETAASLAALINNTDPNKTTALKNYGINIGLAFQLIDDLLDLLPSTNANAKTPGNDLKEGRITLPIIYLLQHGDNNIKQLIHSIIADKAMELLPDLQSAIATSNAIAYTMEQATQHAQLAKQALTAFVNTSYSDAAIALVDFIMQRDY